MSKPRSSALRGSKAAAGPSEKSRVRALNVQARNISKNYTASGGTRTGYKPTASPKPSPSPTPKTGAYSSAISAVGAGLDALNKR